MVRWKLWLWCIGEALIVKGAEALIHRNPILGFLNDVAENAWERFRKLTQEEQLEICLVLTELSQVSPEEARKAAQEITGLLASKRPPSEQQLLTAYLSQVPSVVRQSLRSSQALNGGPGVPRIISGPADLTPFLPPRLPRFLPGDEPACIGSWRLLELVGVGGFGEVWKAQHRSFPDMLAAFKFCLDPESQAHLLGHEGRTIRQILQAGRHAGVVALEDANLETDPPWLRYEYVPGGNLIGALSQVSGAQATEVIRRLAETVGYFHRLSPPVAHRDLKPSNILVQQRSDGRGLVFRIADFGIGGAVQAEPSREVRPTGGPGANRFPTVLKSSHTPLYASPQQREGLLPDVRDDVYALGVLWFQLLQGDLTLEKAESNSWKTRLVGQGLLTLELADLLQACWQDDSRGRPADAGILAEQIRRLQPASPAAVLATPVPQTVPPPGASARQVGEVPRAPLQERGPERGVSLPEKVPGIHPTGSPNASTGRQEGGVRPVEAARSGKALLLMGAFASAGVLAILAAFLMLLSRNGPEHVSQASPAEAPLQGIWDYTPEDLKSPEPLLQIQFNTEKRFGIQMTEQTDPNNRELKKRLTYHPLGGSNNTIVKINGFEYYFGKKIPNAQMLTRQAPLPNNRVGWVTRVLFSEFNILVTQHVEIVPGHTGYLDTCLIYYTLKNQSTVRSTVGLRVMMDTFIGSNDGVPFTIPGQKGFLTTMKEIKDKQIPDYIEVIEQPNNIKDLGTVARMGLKGIRLPGVELEDIQEMRICRFPGSETRWDVTPEPMKDDSCVVLYWDYRPMDVGEERHMAFTYGLSSVDIAATAGSGLALSAPATVQPESEFIVTGYIWGARKNQKVTLELPAELTLADGEDATKTITEAGQREQVSWRVRATSEGTFKIRASSSGTTTKPYEVKVKKTGIFG